MSTSVSAPHRLERSHLLRLQTNEVGDFLEAMDCLIQALDDERRAFDQPGSPAVFSCTMFDARQLEEAALKCRRAYMLARDEMEAKLALQFQADENLSVNAIGEALCNWDYSDLVL